MIKTKNVISSLPLIADALGRKYGIKVQIGGDKAYTNGNEIYLPSMPLDADEIAINLARGYLDHESAHLRFTDFKLLKEADLSPFEKLVWNIIEDFLVERKLGNIYSGCRDNFNWLSRYLFMAAPENGNTTEDTSNVQDILNWLLYSLRSLDVPELNNEKIRLEISVEKNFPDLLPILQPILEEIPVKCIDTATAIDFAKQIAELLMQYAAREKDRDVAQENTDWDTKSVSENEPDPDTSITVNNKEFNSSIPDGSNQSAHHSKSATKSENKKQILKESLLDFQSFKSLGIGDMVENLLQNESAKKGNKLSVSTPMPSCAKELSPEIVFEIKQETMGLRAKLQGLLQASVTVNNRIARTGNVKSSRIARLAVNDPKIFIKRGKKKGFDTLVHILLDASGSMNGKNIKLACQACYAVALALKNSPGIEVMVSAFPAGIKDVGFDSEPNWATVSQILKYRERLHSRFEVRADGYTPLAEALWWVFQTMQPLKEKRKIVLVLSDGKPDNHDEAVNIIQVLWGNGIEVYGIGIFTPIMDILLETKYSRSIYNLKELAPAMMDMLKNSLVDGRRSK